MQRRGGSFASVVFEETVSVASFAISVLEDSVFCIRKRFVIGSIKAFGHRLKFFRRVKPGGKYENPSVKTVAIFFLLFFLFLFEC